MSLDHQHLAIWAAVDRIAADAGLSTSGLAKLAGLDSTAFNRSARVKPNGRLRWPSTETIARVLSVTDRSMDDFARICREVAA